MAEGNTLAYRDVPRHPGYRVDSDGTVWSQWGRSSKGRGRGTFNVLRDTWHELKAGRVGKYGHLQVALGRGNHRGVGPLILESFVGPCPPGLECRHGNGNAGDNRLDNLSWGTSEENTDDQRRHGTLVGGERHGMAKLTDTQIAEIRALAGTMTQQAIADRFGIKQPHVSDILAGKKRTPSSHAGRGV